MRGVVIPTWIGWDRTGLSEMARMEDVIGTWRRRLTHFEFSPGFPMLKCTDLMVKVERFEYSRGEEEDEVFLKWSFGENTSSLDEPKQFQVGYIMKVTYGDDDDAFLEWDYGKRHCHGSFHKRLGTFILNFLLDESIVTITYRWIDQNRLVLVVTEINEDVNHTPSIQYGTLTRVTN